MLIYDFTILSPPEFEEFSRDILQEKLGITFESFKDGKDGGIDFRYSADKRNTIIVQAKRYEKFSYLIRELNKELDKVKNLNPQRYIIVTSVDLSVTEKNKILNIFDGYIKNTSDIIGKKDLNNWLSQYEYLEKKYYKLWFSSTTIMSKILNADIANMSDFTEQEIKRGIGVYVQNESYEEALKILEKSKYVVISGIPGIGKSSLAKMLIYKYLTEGYGLVQASRDIKEAEKLFVEGKKQIFFYDDFLGKVFLDKKLEKNEESRIVQFLKRIRRDKNKKLIMTTREYIFQQAKIEYQEFERLESCIVDLKKYSQLIKAKILYNHLFYSHVPQSYLVHLLKEDNYLKIINHRNYSPRLIEYLTFDYEMYSETETEYFNDFVKLLDNPKELWKKPFEQHISQVSKYLLYTLLLFGESIDINSLKDALANLIEEERKKYLIPYQRESFNNSIRELNQTFIKIENNIVEFQNPSIQDFLINYISQDEDLIFSLISSSIYFQQLFTVFEDISLIPHKSIPSNMKNKILVHDSIVKKLQEITINKFDKLLFVPSSSFRNENELLVKMSVISNFFELDRNLSLKQFLISKIELFPMSNDSNLSYSEARTYLYLVSKLINEVEINKEIFVKKFIESFDSIDNIDDLVELENTFPDEYIELQDDIESKIESIIELELCWLDEDDIDELNDLKDKLEYIERKLYLDLSSEIGDIEDKIEQLEEELEESESENEDETVDGKGYIRKKHVETKAQVKELFKTLEKK
ncbi:restriction endonuclease [Priestia aryabhattai]|uniref:nSTAND3 domain-containing NTPase n=1 Tax=Priestia aryabhattai TaxID=412384 RepID=UPI002E211B6E|nr:restriction endonuclease [Priestia aryabhattai]MED3952604.1 restriction endonuclease [Priestia aryabhattai]